MFDCLFPSAAALGDTIIRQGDEGDNFYIIDEVSPAGADTAVLLTAGHRGHLRQRGKGGQPGRGQQLWRTCAHIRLRPGSHSAGHQPGVALGDRQVGGAAAAARRDVECRDSYKRILMESTMRQRARYEQFLAGISLLEPLDKWERLTIADALESVTFQDGEVIIRKGDSGQEFFLIIEG